MSVLDFAKEKDHWLAAKNQASERAGGLVGLAFFVTLGESFDALSQGKLGRLHHQRELLEASPPHLPPDKNGILRRRSSLHA